MSDAQLTTLYVGHISRPRASEPATVPAHPIGVLRRGWPIYFALLVTLPDSVRITGWPFAPETLLLFVLLAEHLFGTLVRNSLRSVTEAFSLLPKATPVLLIVLLVGFARAGSPTDAIRLLVWAANAYAGVLCVRNRDTRSAVFVAWQIAAVLACALFLAQPHLWDSEEVNILAWEHRTGLGYFLVVPLGICMTAAVERSGLSRFLQIGIGLLYSAALVMLSSRGPWLASLAWLLLWRLRSVSAKRFVAEVAFVAAVLAALTLSSEVLDDRVRSIWDFRIASSSFYRLDLAQAALKSTLRVGPLGGGAHSAGAALAGNTIQDYTHLLDEAFVTDSDPIWVAMEYGPIAAAALLGTYLVLLWRLSNRVAKDRRALTSIAARSALVMTFCIMSVFDNLLSSPYGWYLLGLASGIDAND